MSAAAHQSHMEAAQSWLASTVAVTQLPFKSPRFDPFVLLLPEAPQPVDEKLLAISERAGRG
jgi:hypothetical protein